MNVVDKVAVGGRDGEGWQVEVQLRCQLILCTHSTCLPQQSRGRGHTLEGWNGLV
ncbi:hypothetical protein J6590_041330 [Homalodisca vitripennis]|nr:hypothetical protein J6590_041330 [Homalodisca vitripennis]